MKLSLPVILALAILTASPLLQANAQTVDHLNHESLQDDQSIDDDDEPVQRVGRLSFVDGDVSFLRAGVTEWADAVQNLPLLTGDQLYVGKGGRAEIQLGNGNYVRLSEGTAITIADLTHTVAQLELTEGTAIIRLERFGAAFTRFEVDTPNASLVLDQDGLYRVNVAGAEESEIIIRRGSAEVATLDGSFKVREGHRLLVDTSTNGRLEVAVDNSRDDWDRWNYDRDQTIDRDVVAASPDYINQHETTFHCFFGASELARYGSWTQFGTYGYCWVPRVASGWAPYRSGQWLWVPRVGWSWLAYEPWGWAPYHYGRWAHLPGIGWAWVPGIHSNRYNYRHSYYQWRPALVSFFNCPTSRGHYVGWYPLSPGERWRRPERFGRDRNDPGRLGNRGPRNGDRRPDSDDDAGATRLAKTRNGVSILPVAGFTRPGQTSDRPSSPDGEVTRWVATKGVRQGLPDLGPTEAFAPPKRRGADGTSRTTVKPPIEVAGRPVVTRNRPSTAQVETSVPRERRLVSPRQTLVDPTVPFLGERGKREGRRTNAGTSESDGNGNAGNKRREVIRAPDTSLPNSDKEAQPRKRQRDAEGQDAGDGGADNSKRRARIEKETSDPNNKDDKGGDSSDSNENNERSRVRFRPAPPAGDSGSADKPKTDGDQSGHKPKAERPRNDEGSQPRSDEYRKKNDSDDGSKNRREHTAPPAERPQPRVEQKQEQQQEHREQKQERREERREERRKGNQ